MSMPRRFVLGGTLILVSAYHTARGATPVVSRLHTLSIHVRSHAVHDSVYALLTDVLQLPPTYEPVTYGTRKYAAVQAGNVCLEPCGPYPDQSYVNTNFEAMFYGLTFEPYESASASAVELKKRAIRHGEPTQSVRVTDEDLSAPNVVVSIGEKENRNERLARAAELAAKGGGPIGLRHVDEIQIGYSDHANLRKWIEFLRPAEREGENVYRIGDGLALRFVKGDSKQVLGITMKVRSLERASAFLRQEGLLGRVGNEEVELHRGKTHGLRIVLRE